MKKYLHSSLSYQTRVIGIQGFLNVSVNVIKEGETVEYENRIDELQNNELLIPHNIRKEEYEFICILHCIDYGIEDNIFVYLQIYQILVLL